MLHRALILVLAFPMLAFSQTPASRAHELFAQKKYAQAQAVYVSVLEENPRDELAVERLGDILAHSRNWQQAAVYYRRLIQLDPKSGNAWYKYGGALAMDAASGNKIRSIGFLTDIRESFEKAIELEPKHIEAHWALVEYYLQVPWIFGGSETKANIYADALAPVSKVDYYLAKGRIEKYFSRYANAEKFYLKAHAIGNSRTTLQKLTSIYARMGRADKAKAAVQAFESPGKQTNQSTTSI